MTGGIRLEPEAEAFVQAAMKPPLLLTSGVQWGRAALEETQSRPIDTPLVDIVDLIIADGPSQHLALRILRAPAVRAAVPVVVYFHGGGWICGSKRTHNRLLCELAIGAQAAVVFPEYRLSSESSYPTDVEECYMAVKWIAEPVAVSSSHNLDAAVTSAKKRHRS